MTKKDYISIAKAVRASTKGEEVDAEALVLSLCAVFKEDNELFDGKRFRKACGT